MSSSEYIFCHRDTHILVPSLLFCESPVRVATEFTPPICKEQQREETWRGFSVWCKSQSQVTSNPWLKGLHFFQYCEYKCLLCPCKLHTRFFNIKKSTWGSSVCSNNLLLFSATTWAQQGIAHPTLPFMVQFSHHKLKKVFHGIFAFKNFFSRVMHKDSR